LAAIQNAAIVRRYPYFVWRVTPAHYTSHLYPSVLQRGDAWE
jgi:hypothetical protein